LSAALGPHHRFHQYTFYLVVGSMSFDSNIDRLTIDLRMRGGMHYGGRGMRYEY